MIARLVGLALAVTTLVAIERGEAPSPNPCPAVDVSEGAITNAGLADLLAAGWHGDPTDGREVLYPAGC